MDAIRLGLYDKETFCNLACVITSQGDRQMNPFVQGDYLGACRHIEKAYKAVKEIANDTVNLQKSHPINKVLRHLSKAIESCSD